MDAGWVKVASDQVIVLGGAWFGVAGKDLGVPAWDIGIERVGYRGVAQRVRADVPRDAGNVRDRGNDAVGIPAVDQ